MSTFSWVDSANAPGCDFPLQNLPYGVFAIDGTHRIGVAIGDRILDLHACVKNGIFDNLPVETREACQAQSLNDLMSLGRKHWAALRSRITELLRSDSPNLAVNRKQVEPLLVLMTGVAMQLPATIGDYTDFYASVFHATNVGRMFRPDNPLMPNYKYVPIGYHGRASSIVASGTDVRRPLGQTKPPAAEAPVFGPSKLLDYELEVGIFIGPGNELGTSIAIREAESHIFGYCLLNDWSARDIQAWEYQPLGPFLAKSFASTISPWVVTAEALAPFRSPAFLRPEGDPAPLDYLTSPQDQENGALDVTLEVFLLSEKMKQDGMAPTRVSRNFLRDLYWTPAQFVTHHSSNGCNLRPGDLLGSGTISGPTKDSLGSLLELTQRGAAPITLPSGEQRKFLEDGDEIIIRGYCEREDAVRIGFGECRSMIMPARSV
ncbi:MAG: fumarylacetoacetase [Bryobacteraceae bacterium]